ncbi:recombination regulator RecX [Endozoicomonas sp. G2_1]|uniref:recombination regulator RecX n=1 Tax=Endozoicomonas sp. G2_1 TaxID=2821091 RepID=UPI001ADCC320|nr:recombination regulator RecX [Endozoicomonas sp. G2_1]MBO9491141.1 recombination regulator RecX [Endozoicomonas sp. G2_1]
MNTEALHRAVDLLSRREHSAKELTNKLKQKDFSSDDIAEVLLYLQDKNYQSDARFAESACNSRVNKGYGWRYIQQELSFKGVSSSVISELKESLTIDWYYQAELAYNRRFGDSEIKDQKDKAKRIRFLQSRGFDSDQIFSLIS